MEADLLVVALVEADLLVVALVVAGLLEAGLVGHLVHRVKRPLIARASRRRNRRSHHRISAVVGDVGVVHRRGLVVVESLLKVLR